MGEAPLAQGEPLPRNTEHDARIRAELERRGVRWECPSCRSANVDVEETTGMEPGLPFFTLSERGSRQSALLPLYLLRCRNCGLVRCHDRAIVDAITP